MWTGILRFKLRFTFDKMSLNYRFIRPHCIQMARVIPFILRAIFNVSSTSQYIACQVIISLWIISAMIYINVCLFMFWYWLKASIINTFARSQLQIYIFMIADTSDNKLIKSAKTATNTYVFQSKSSVRCHIENLYIIITKNCLLGSKLTCRDK